MSELRKAYAIVFWPESSKRAGLLPTVDQFFVNEGSATTRYYELLAISSTPELWLLEYEYCDGYEPIHYSKLACGDDVKLSAMAWPKRFANDFADKFMDYWHEKYDASIQDDINSSIRK